MPTFDLNGRRWVLPQAVVVAARDAAAARAASSSPLRDLSLLLDAALAGRLIALRRNEVRLLRELATTADLPDLAEALPADDAAGHGS